ncbi:hypothetical protein ACFPU1_03155 [Thalassorhabdus alkalitolerans]|uniref:Kinase n=1 Tax=Thalassorhabdus alkalitolerans TaxID=2282697 RepID=A0ABW0YM06_9BACI
MNKFETITVMRKGEKTYINNPTKFCLIGKGHQGAVFRVSYDRCVKIYVKEKYCTREKYALKAAQDYNIVPIIYEAGSKYIVMEYLTGGTLADYLLQYRTFPEETVKQILYIFKMMEKIGFSRIDAKLRHLLMSKEGEVKVVDHVNSFRKKHFFPVDFFKDLKKINLYDSFIDQAKKIDQEQINKWKNQMDNQA